MTIYKTRYVAKKEAKSYERVVKVCGGYVIMTEDQYRVWRSQR